MDQQQLADAKPLRLIIFVVMPVFMGYAALFSLQRKVKVELGIADDDSSDSHEFSFAVSFLFTLAIYSSDCCTISYFHSSFHDIASMFR